MPKKSLAQSIREKTAKYRERRAANPHLEDLKLPIPDNQLVRRVCHTAEAVDAAIQPHLEEADRELERGGAYWMVLDVEGYLVNKWLRVNPSSSTGMNRT